MSGGGLASMTLRRRANMFGQLLDLPTTLTGMWNMESLMKVLSKQKWIKKQYDNQLITYFVYFK